MDQLRRATLALLGLVLLGGQAEAASVAHFASYDVNTAGTAASAVQFNGGVSGSNVPTFVANTVFPGTNNRIALDLDLSAVDGSTDYGTVLLGAAQSKVSLGAYAYPTLGVVPKCVGGSANGQFCIDDTYCSSIAFRDGTCTPQRTPLLAFGDGTNRGCVLYQSQVCGSMAYSFAFSNRTCGSPSIKYEVMYGTSAQTGSVGVCSSTRTMDGSPCGGPCTGATATTVCTQGRTAVDLTAGSLPTRCVKNTDETTDCTSGGSEGCHCINECDENRPFESQCGAAVIGSVVVAPNTPIVLQVEQENGANGGEVACTLRSGGLNATTLRSEVFPRGTTQASLQKVGVCTGGTFPVDGGRKGTACSGAAGSCNCDTGSNGYNAGTCTNGTCSTTARISPDRFTVGTTTATDKTRTLLDKVLVQTGSGTHVWNWRDETLRVDGIPGGASDATMWTGTRTGCGTANQGNCFRGGGTIANEPDGNTSSLETNNESVVESVTFENLKTSGTDYSATDQPIAAALSVAAQDRSQNNTEGVIIAIEAFDGTTATTGYNPSNGNSSTCDGPGGCTGIGYFLQENVDRGNTAVYEQMPTKLLTTNITSGTALNALSVANAIAAVNGYQGQFRKNGYDGTGSGTTTKGRLTFAELDVALATANPASLNVLPGNKRLAKVGDSRCDKAILFQLLTSRLTEPTAIYKQCRGGVALGDILADFAMLLAGGSAGISTQAYVGTTGQNVDVMFIEGGINTLHNAAGTADPALPASREGIPQRGYCEDWTGSGYGPNQAKPCYCDATNNWTTGGVGAFTGISLVKNSSFGTISGFNLNGGQPSCSGANAANGINECQMGGSAPGSPGTITSTTCSSSKCASTNVNAPNLDANAPATNRIWKGIGCTGRNTPVDTGAVNCDGVCLTGNSVPRMMRAVIAMTDIAARSPANPSLVWETTPLATAVSGNEGLFGWWNVGPKVHQWNTTLLTWAQANGKNWVDLAAYFMEKAGPSTLYNPANANTIESDGIHYRTTALEWEADLETACATNTTLEGTSGKTTDGVCTSAAGSTCSGGKCTSGLRIGMLCTADSQCNYCSGGSPLKLGRQCTSDETCGRYRCVF